MNNELFKLTVLEVIRNFEISSSRFEIDLLKYFDPFLGPGSLYDHKISIRKMAKKKM